MKTSRYKVLWEISFVREPRTLKRISSHKDLLRSCLLLNFLTTRVRSDPLSLTINNIDGFGNLDNSRF